MSEADARLAQPSDPDGVKGAQSVQRAISILRLVAHSGAGGARATELAGKLGLNLATTDRMLRVLAQENLIERALTGREYRVGPEVVALAATRLQGFSIITHFRHALQHIAAHTSDTVFLWVRSGDEAICMAREEGDYPVRVLAVDVGVRRPLGIGAGPLAQLAFLPDAEVERIIAKHRKRYVSYGLSAEDVKEMIVESRRLGIAFNPGRIIPEMTALGHPILNLAGHVVGSIAVAAVSERMKAGRVQEIADLLKQVVNESGPVSEQ